MKKKLTETQEKNLKFKDKCRYTIIKSKILDYKELGLYCFINEHYNLTSGYAYPSHETMRKGLNISEPTLNKLLNSLVEKKVIIRKKGKEGQNTRYYLIIPQEAQIKEEEEKEEVLTLDDYSLEELQILEQQGFKVKY